MSIHYMQTNAWAGIKSAFGWRTQTLPEAEGINSVVIYSRNIPTLGKLNYIPGISGLTATNAKPFTNELKKDLKGFVIRLEPYQLTDENIVKVLKQAGWISIKRHIQYRHTVFVDLVPSENEILKSFKSRGRYEIKQATNFGVKIELVEPSQGNLEIMYKLLLETSSRNKFYIRDKNFTMKYWKNFIKEGNLRLFFAKHGGDILAASVILVNGEYAWYKEGGSLKEKSNLMAPRLLLWEAMKQLKKESVKTFDLGGIPDPSSHQSSSMHGIYVFKTAYSRETVELMPTMELPLNKRYNLWPKVEEHWLRIYNLFTRNLWW